VALPSDILRRSPEESARRIALELLDGACAAAERLADLDDAEALHDFRVAVRRLRSALRAWRPELAQSVAKRQRRALRALQATTGEGRDAEVALEWLAQQRPELGRGQRRGCDWLVQRLEPRRSRSRAQAREQVRLEFERIERELRGRLERMTAEVHLLQPAVVPSFGPIFADRAREAAHELARRVAAVASPDQRQACHRARIACKRLRYLIEPLRNHAQGAAGIVKRCRGLQDVLGDLNDAHILGDELAAALEDVTLEQARRLLDLAREQDPEQMRRERRRAERSGLLELARRVQLGMRRRFEELEKDWLGAGIGALVEEVEALARRVAAAGESNVEIERKYLLRGLPRLPDGTEAVEVDQGWLPGSLLRERLRRVRRGDDVAYYRALKLGEGVRRIEFEEATPRELFEPLWLLTRGCRVHKRRHLVPDGGLVWEIDEFRDRDLVLAEVELPRASERPQPPHWLAGFVVREVTDDPRYTNLHLAQKPGWVPEED
jgi:CHAD domain-containing protein/CYTH domain-containing protein